MDLKPERSEPPPAGRAGLFRRFRREGRGVVAIEFAILALPFIMMIFAVLETALVFLGELTLDQAVERVARIVRTGEAQTSGMTEAQFRQALCNEVSMLMNCSGLSIDLRTYPNYASLPSAPPKKNGDLDTTGFAYAPGGANTIIALRVFYKWPIFTDIMRASLSDMRDGSHLITATAAFKTEPY